MEIRDSSIIYNIERDSDDELEKMSETFTSDESEPEITKTEIVKSTNAHFDTNCDPDDPKIIKFQDISIAAYRIKNGIVRTPCTVCI